MNGARWTSLVALVAIIVHRRDAWAQTGCPSQAQADSYEELGHRLLVNRAEDQQANDREALRVLEVAARLCPPSPRLLARIATAHQVLGRWSEAETFYLRALAMADDDWLRSHRDELNGHLVEVRNRSGLLRVVGGGCAGGMVFIDGRRVGDFPMAEAVRTSLGHVEVRVEAPRCRTATRSAEVEALGTTQVTITLEHDVPATPVRPSAEHASPPEPPRAPPPSNVVRWVLLGTSIAFAAAGIVVGAAYAIEAGQRRDLYDAECPNGGMWRRDDAGCLALRDAIDATDVSVMRPLGFTLGGVFAVTALVLGVTMPARQAPSRATLRCGPGPTMIGLGCGLSF